MIFSLDIFGVCWILIPARDLQESLVCGREFSPKAGIFGPQNQENALGSGIPLQCALYVSAHILMQSCICYMWLCTYVMACKRQRVFRFLMSTFCYLCVMLFHLHQLNECLGEWGQPTCTSNTSVSVTALMPGSHLCPVEREPLGVMMILPHLVGSAPQS